MAAYRYNPGHGAVGFCKLKGASYIGVPLGGTTHRICYSPLLRSLAMNMKDYLKGLQVALEETVTSSLTLPRSSSSQSPACPREKSGSKWKTPLKNPSLSQLKSHTARLPAQGFKLPIPKKMMSEQLFSCIDAMAARDCACFIPR